MSREYVVWGKYVKCIGFARQEVGRYKSDEFLGVVYQLEYRKRNALDGSPDSGWYLYSEGSDTWNFFGEWCASLIRDAVDVANEMIMSMDLRGGSVTKREEVRRDLA